MIDFAILWRIRGSIALPPTIEEEGLIARVADILAQDGAVITTEEERLLRFSAPGTWLREPGLDTLSTIDGGQVRLEGIRGRRTLRYDFSALRAFVSALAASAFLALFIVAIIYPPMALPMAAIGFGFIYGLPNVLARARIRGFLDRALPN